MVVATGTEEPVDRLTLDIAGVGALLVAAGVLVLLMTRRRAPEHPMRTRRPSPVGGFSHSHPGTL